MRQCRLDDVWRSLRSCARTMGTAQHDSSPPYFTPSTPCLSECLACLNDALFKRYFFFTVWIGHT
jgi:hypothetical protein